MTQENKDILAVHYMADRLGVDLQQPKKMVAGSEPVTVLGSTGELEVNVGQTWMRMFKPGKSGVRIDLVWPNDFAAPEGALYRIVASTCTPKGSTELNTGDLHAIYIGPKGIILEEDTKKMIAKEYTKPAQSRGRF